VPDCQRPTIPSVDIVVGDNCINTREFYPFISAFYFYCYTQQNYKGNSVPADIRIVEASSDLLFSSHRLNVAGGHWVFSIFGLTLFSSSTSYMIPGIVISMSSQLAIEPSWAVLLPCLVTLNSNSQPCKMEFGSSPKLFPLLP
jgi:hypothetical protein